MILAANAKMENFQDSVALLVCLHNLLHSRRSETPEPRTGREIMAPPYKQCNPHGNSQLQDRVSRMEQIISNWRL